MVGFAATVTAIPKREEGTGADHGQSSPVPQRARNASRLHFAPGALTGRAHARKPPLCSECLSLPQPGPAVSSRSSEVRSCTSFLARQV